MHLYWQQYKHRGAVGDAGAGHETGRRRAVGLQAVGLFLVDLSVIDETGIGRQFRELLVLFLAFVDPAAEIRALFPVPGRIRLELCFYPFSKLFNIKRFWWVKLNYNGHSL